MQVGRVAGLVRWWSFSGGWGHEGRGEQMLGDSEAALDIVGVHVKGRRC